MDINKYMQEIEEKLKEQKTEEEIFEHIETVENDSNDFDSSVDNSVVNNVTDNSVNSVASEFGLGEPKEEGIENTETAESPIADFIDLTTETKEPIIEEKVKEDITEIKTEPKELKVELKEQVEENKALAEQPTNSVFSVGSVVGDVQQTVLGRAKAKINSEKILDKHADKIAKVTDRAMEVETERVSLTVEQQDADNKVTKQEIRNKLIVLNAEAKRLEKEQKQLNKEQKADHKARNNAAKWELYKDKLTKMKYSYVPNVFILSMLLFFDGVRSFFDGLGTVSTAIVKAFKWVILIGVILIVLFAIPVTRDWLLNLFRGKM